MIAASALFFFLAHHAPDEVPDQVPVVLRDREAAASACLRATPPPASAPSSVTLTMRGPTLRYVVDESDARALGPTLAACIERAFANVPAKSPQGQTPNFVTLALDAGDPRTARVSNVQTILGSLDKEQIRAVVRAGSPKIKACYDAEVALDAHTAPDSAVIRFVIGPDGKVRSKTVEQKKPAANARLGTCVVSAIRTLEFPEPKGGGIVIVTYPFVFKRVDAPGLPTGPSKNGAATESTSGAPFGSEGPVPTKRVRGDEHSTEPATGCLGLW